MIILALTLALAAPSSTPPCDPSSVYAAVRVATGIRPGVLNATVLAQGGAQALGFSGSFDSAIDERDGRSSLRLLLGPMKMRTVYDGTTLWRQDYSGGVHPLDSPNARAAAVTQAYLDRFAFLAPRFGGASVRCLPARVEGQRAFYAMRIVPPGGLPIEQWIDARTFLVDRTIRTTPTSTEIVRSWDYRIVDSVAMPFAIERSTAGDPSDTVTMHVRDYRLVSDARAPTFSRPPDPGDTSIAGGASSTTVPIAIEAGDAIVQARIDGKGPFPFILDTGGHAILTPQAARAIGLQSQGTGSSGGGGSGRVSLSFARVRELRVGAAIVPNQTFLVIPYDINFSDRGNRPPIAGILGLELFERFAVRIDYARATLTLSPLRSFLYRGSARATPIVFQDDMPLARASADGHAGWFGLDTGNSGSPILFGPWLARTGILATARLGSAATGSGTGGAVHLFRQTLERMSFAGSTFTGVPAFFVVGQRGGSFSSTTEAGNLGYQTLGYFATTFDYARGALYADPASAAPAPAFGRSGLGLSKNVRERFVVDAVLPGSPAATNGVAVNDSVTAIDGIPARALGQGDVYRLMRQPVGTVVTLEVVHGGKTRLVTLYLKEFIPSASRKAP